MFKTMILTALTMISAQAFAGSEIELFGKLVNMDCTIKNGVVTKTMSFSKEKDLSFSTSHKINVDGLEKYAERAVALTTNNPHVNTDYKFKITMDGKTTEINQADSKEALYVVRMIVQACK
ncbi:MAG: hypothetical protein NDI69_01840 [Bacteriovoracaceae bacterium]|nr:hypothetical protein [Bacteriovoracaceae bacterium]